MPVCSNAEYCACNIDGIHTSDPLLTQSRVMAGNGLVDQQSDGIRSLDTQSTVIGTDRQSISIEESNSGSGSGSGSGGSKKGRRKERTRTRYKYSRTTSPFAINASCEDVDPVRVINIYSKRERAIQFSM